MDRPGDSRVEELVVEFLEQRVHNPELTPSSFASAYPEVSSLLTHAIHSTLTVLDSISTGTSTTPRTIGPYRVVGELGRGGMGVVYDVERDGDRFALKLLPLAPFHGVRALERFRREVAILSRLEHPRIVRVVDSGIADEPPYLVMEKVDGQPLDRAAGKVSHDYVLYWLTTLAETVAAAHRCGVVHRDLKPQNVLASGENLVLLDFGLGHASEMPSLTSTGDIVGTPRYLAPEQARGSQVDPRVDVYGIGGIGFELLAGRPAFDQATRAEVIEAILAGDRPRLDLLVSETQPGLCAIIEKALAVEPDDRYATVEELREDLERCTHGDAVHASTPHVSMVRRLWQRWQIRRDRRATGQNESSRASAIRAVEAWMDHDLPSLQFELDQWRDDGSSDIRRVMATLSAGAPSSGQDRRHDLGSDTQPAEDLSPLESAVRCISGGDLTGARHALSELSESVASADELTAGLVAYLRGLVALDTRHWRVAEQELDLARDLFPGAIQPALGLAEACRGRGRPDQAIELLEWAVRRRPEHLSAWRALVRARQEASRLPEAEAALREVRRLTNGGDVAEQVLEGTIRARAGERAAARELLEAAVDKVPDDAYAWRELALILDTEHLVDEAASAYEHSLALAPDDALALTSLANLRVGGDLGRCARCDEVFAEHPQLIDHSEAEQLLVRALQATRDENPALLETIQYVALKLSRRSELIGEVEQTLEDSAADSSARLRLQTLLRHLRLRDD